MVLETHPTAHDLDAQTCLYFAALLAAQAQRLPVAPTERMTLMVMEALRERGIIEVPWPNQCWGIRPRAERTPIEQLEWCCRWDASLRTKALLVLEDHLRSVPMTDDGLAVRLHVWSELAIAESEHFFEEQLRKHRFALEWAQDVAFVYRDARRPMSIAKWRYCCWAATRHGASVSQQQRVPYAAAVREAIYVELGRRASLVASGAWDKCSFPPSDPKPANALGRVFVTQLARIGTRFWVDSPEVENLLPLAGST